MTQNKFKWQIEAEFQQGHIKDRAAFRNIIISFGILFLTGLAVITVMYIGLQTNETDETTIQTIAGRLREIIGMLNKDAHNCF